MNVRGAGLTRPLAIALTALALAGCAEPTAKVTPQPTAAATARATPTETLTAFPTDAPAPSPTPLPTPWPVDESLPVVLTVDEAEREVLSWALPEREARIERSAYVSSADFEAASSPSDGEDRWPWLADTPTGWGSGWIESCRHPDG